MSTYPRTTATLIALFASTLSATPLGETTKLLPDDGSAEQNFGTAVDANEQYLLIGSPGDLGGDRGAAYVFDAVTGTQLMKLEAEDGQADDAFGISVALSGSLAVIGADLDDDNGMDTGSAYVFDLSTGQQLFKLLPSNGASRTQFGWAVDVEGDVAIIGAYDELEVGVVGAAYLFDVSTGLEVRELAPTSGSVGDGYGAGVAISGSVALVGAPFDATNGADSGAAYVFDVGTGNQLHKLFPDVPQVVDLFGYGLDVQGTTAVIGASQDDGASAGRVLVFDTLSGDQLDEWTADDGAVGDAFGISVALHGSTVVIGADLDDDNGAESGSAYVFDLFSGEQLEKLTSSDGAAGDAFGFAVAVNSQSVLAGAWGESTNGSNAGAAYLYTGSTVGPGVAFCFGDGLGSPCPCGNDAAGGSGSGCLNSTGVGARLAAAGSSSLTADDLSLNISQATDGTPGVIFAGDVVKNRGLGLPFLDGLSCVKGQILRVYKFPSLTGGAGSYPLPGTPSLAQTVGALPGTTIFFQYWYRDAAGPCAMTANTTNAVRVTWGL